MRGFLYDMTITAVLIAGALAIGSAAGFLFVGPVLQ